MKNLIEKTFGGLTPQYYFRQFVFGIIIGSLFVLIQLEQHGSVTAIDVRLMILTIINVFLYPYSRFAYEKVVGFIMGENIFIINVFIMFIVKIFTMLLCWSFAIFFAPVGLIYLFFYHSKTRNEAE